MSGTLDIVKISLFYFLVGIMLPFVVTSNLTCFQTLGNVSGQIDTRCEADNFEFVSDRPVTFNLSDKQNRRLSPHDLCISHCLMPTTYFTVCGTDGITYDNQLLVHCKQICGEDIGIRHDGPCFLNETEEMK